MHTYIHITRLLCRIICFLFLSLQEIQRNDAKVLLTMVDLCGKEGEDEVPPGRIRECQSINADLHDLRTYFDNKSKQTQAALNKPLMKSLKDVLDDLVLLVMWKEKKYVFVVMLTTLAPRCGK